MYVNGELSHKQETSFEVNHEYTDNIKIKILENVI